MKYTLTIPGEPTGKGRPRVTRFGTHTPEQTVLYENLIKTMTYQQNGTVAFLEGPLVMRIVAYFKIPSSTPKKQVVLMQKGQIRPTKKPDTDNIAKIIGDALNEVWYKDDSAIVDEHVKKWYGEPARVEVEVEEWMPE